MKTLQLYEACNLSMCSCCTICVAGLDMCSVPTLVLLSVKLWGRASQLTRWISEPNDRFVL